LCYLVLVYYLYQKTDNLILAIVIVVSLQQAKVYIFSKYLGMLPLHPMDFFFLYDDKKNRANIITVAIATRINNMKEVRERFKARAVKFPRMRSRIVRYLGEYYWQEIPKAELDSYLDKLIIDLKDVKINNEE